MRAEQIEEMWQRVRAELHERRWSCPWLNPAAMLCIEDGDQQVDITGGNGYLRPRY